MDNTRIENKIIRDISIKLINIFEITLNENIKNKNLSPESITHIINETLILFATSMIHDLCKSLNFQDNDYLEDFLKYCKDRFLHNMDLVLEKNKK